MAYVDFMSLVHKSTKRDYVARVNEIDKAEAAEKAIQWGYDYWDGDRRINYGGVQRLRFYEIWQHRLHGSLDHFHVLALAEVQNQVLGSAGIQFDRDDEPSSFGKRQRK